MYKNINFMNNIEYDINDYTDEELFNLLDLTNPSDRILEAKILMMIQKYSEIDSVSGRKLTKFFEDVYSHFFESEEEEEEEIVYEKEGFETKTNEQPSMKEILEALTNIVTVLNKGNSIASDVTKGNTVIKSTNLEYVKSNINPILKQTCKRICMFDSQYRDTTLYPISGNYLINLSDPLFNVLSLRLHTINIPFTWYNVSKNYNYNYFTLTSTGNGFENVYQFKFGIEGGSYSMTQLTQALQNAITTVAAQNPDTNFGSTSITFSQSTGKMSLTLDIGNIYTTNNYYLDFPNWSNPYDKTTRNNTIAGFLGFIPPTSPYVEESSQIVLSKIYSNFNYAEQLTQNISGGFENTTLAYNQVDFYTTGASANNYFTIYNYDGTNGTTYPFDPSGYRIYDKIVVSFNINTFLYNATRETITNNLNAALQLNPLLDPSSNISQVYLPNYDDASGNNYMYYYALNIILNRNTVNTHKVAGMNQIIVFPPVDATYEHPIWTGPNSCFLFDTNNSLQQLNNLTSQISVSPIWSIISSPYIYLKCNKLGYTDNSYNSFVTNIANGTYPSNEYLTVYAPAPENSSQVIIPTPQNSIINGALAITTNNAKLINQQITNLTQIMYYNPDLSSNNTVGNFSITTVYDTSDFYLDLSNSIFNQSWNFPKTINGTTQKDISDNDFWNITSSNNTLTIRPILTHGTVGIPALYATIDICNNVTPYQITESFNNITIDKWYDLSGNNATIYGINNIDISSSFVKTGATQNILTINTSPFIDISCITPGYSNRYTVNIGDVSGELFNNYIGTRNNYSDSIVNTALFSLDASSHTINHTNNSINAVVYYDANYIDASGIYDPSCSYTVGNFDLSINYDITDFQLDFSGCPFLTNLGVNTIIDSSTISFQIPKNISYSDYSGQFFTLNGISTTNNLIRIPAILQNTPNPSDFTMTNIVNNSLNPAIHNANNPVQYGVDWSDTNFYYDPSGGVRSIGSVTIADSPQIQLTCTVPGYDDISNANITIPIILTDGSTNLFTDYLGLSTNYSNSIVNQSINSLNTGLKQIHNPAFTKNVNNQISLYYDDTVGQNKTVGIFDFSINYYVSDFYLDLSDSIFYQQWGFPKEISNNNIQFATSIVDISSQIASSTTWTITPNVNNTIVIRPQSTSGTANVSPIYISIGLVTNGTANQIITLFNQKISTILSNIPNVSKVDFSGTNVQYEANGGTGSDHNISITTNPQIQLLCSSGYDNSYNNITIQIPNNTYTYNSYIETVNTNILASLSNSKNNNPAISNDTSFEIYYDNTNDKFMGNLGIHIQYTGADYYLDLTKSIFNTSWGFNAYIDGSSNMVSITANVDDILYNITNDHIQLYSQPNSGAYIPDSVVNIAPPSLSGTSSLSVNDIISEYNSYIRSSGYTSLFSAYGVIDLSFSYVSGVVTLNFSMDILPITNSYYTVNFTDNNLVSTSWMTDFNFIQTTYNLSSNTPTVLSNTYLPIIDYSDVVIMQFYVQPYSLTENDYIVSFDNTSLSTNTSWQNDFYLDYSYNLSNQSQISGQTYTLPYEYSGLLTLNYNVKPYTLTASDFCVTFGDTDTSTNEMSSWSKYFYLKSEPYLLSQSIVQSDISYNALVPNINTVFLNYTVSVDPIDIRDYDVYFGDYSGNLYDSSSSSWEYFMGLGSVYDLSNNYNSKSQTSTFNSIMTPLDASLNMITIDNSNSTFYLRPQSNIKGLTDLLGINDITITLQNGKYTQSSLFNEINKRFYDYSSNNAPYSLARPTLVLYTDPSTNIQYSQFQFNVGRTYNAKDYNLTFFDPSSAVLYQANIGGTCTVMPQVWGITIGWQIGFHSSPIYYLNPDFANTVLNTLSPLTTSTQTMTLANSYTYDPSTNIITLTGDTVVDLYLYYNFFIILDDGVMNRLNDGLVTVTDKDNNIDSSSYSSVSQSKRVLNNTTTINNFTNSVTSNNLTQAQYYSASQKTISNVPQYKPIQPTNLSDCFAVLPLKQQGLTIGQTYTDSGGTLQDNNRVYFGPVNIRQATIQLVSDRGEVVDLNGANWSFCMVAEYLYSQAGMENNQNLVK